MTVAAWGSAFVGIRAAGETLSPGALALGRLLVSTAILGSVALVRRERLPARRDLLAIAAFGVLWLGVYSTTLNAAERRVDAGTAAMLINTGPILIVVLAGILLREGFPPWLFAGCALAFAGCVLIGLASSRSEARAGLGIALCVVAALAYAVAVVVQKPVLARVSPFQVDLARLRGGHDRAAAVRSEPGERRGGRRCSLDRLDGLSRAPSRRRSASRPGRSPSAGRAPAGWRRSRT